MRTYYSAHFLAAFGWMPMATTTTPELWEDTLRRCGDHHRVCGSIEEARATAIALNAALTPEERLVIETAERQRAEELKAKLAEPIPSIDACKQAGTHMVRCTADGACKVCFDNDGSVPLYVAEYPDTASGIPAKGK